MLFIIMNQGTVTIGEGGGWLTVRANVNGNKDGGEQRKQSSIHANN